MYYEPETRSKKRNRNAAERAQELAEANEEKEGELTMEFTIRVVEGQELFRTKIPKLATISSCNI